MRDIKRIKTMVIKSRFKSWIGKLFFFFFWITNHN